MTENPVPRRPRHQAPSTPDNDFREDFARTFHRNTGISTGTKWCAKHRGLVPMKSEAGLA